MIWWIVTAHTVRVEDGQPIRGTHTWWIKARFPIDAERQVRSHAGTDTAVRHRRGADLDTADLTTTPRPTPGLLLGGT
ncbi:hypothetical protein AB0M29_17430 [Streptomyces sp. NPDC051976]|uniref:hypothetical protein n=1 Tax=Streptomyces sp. NPDC051976 TaxID=3154947 RepID=UPI0034498182